MTTRADMINRLSSSSATPTKTFVLEVHSDEPADYLRELVGRGNMEETTDAYLYRAYGGDGISFWVDQLDERFWSFHTQDPIRNVLPFLRSKVEERRDLDWMWLPSEHLRNIWPGATARRVRSEFHASEIVAPAGTGGKPRGGDATGRRGGVLRQHPRRRGADRGGRGQDR